MTENENWPVQSPWGGYSIDLTKLKSVPPKEKESESVETEEKEKDV